MKIKLRLNNQAIPLCYFGDKTVNIDNIDNNPINTDNQEVNVDNFDNNPLNTDNQEENIDNTSNTDNTTAIQKIVCYKLKTWRRFLKNLYVNNL